MHVLIELLIAFVLFIIVFTLGMSVVTSPVLVLLYLDKTHRLQKFVYRIGYHESEIENSTTVTILFIWHWPGSKRRSFFGGFIILSRQLILQ
jgi:hypothetical protein